LHIGAVASGQPKERQKNIDERERKQNPTIRRRSSAL